MQRIRVLMKTGNGRDQASKLRLAAKAHILEWEFRNICLGRKKFHAIPPTIF